MLLAVHSGVEPGAEAVARLEQAVSGARLKLQFDVAGPVGFDPDSDTVDDALAVLLSIVTKERRGRDWQHLKVCARDGCQQAFYDASASRTGRWCTRRCGDRVRTEAFRKTDKYKKSYKY